MHIMCRPPPPPQPTLSSVALSDPSCWRACARSLSLTHSSVHPPSRLLTPFFSLLPSLPCVLSLCVSISPCVSISYELSHFFFFQSRNVRSLSLSLSLHIHIYIHPFTRMCVDPFSGKECPRTFSLFLFLLEERTILEFSDRGSTFLSL